MNQGVLFLWKKLQPFGLGVLCIRCGSISRPLTDWSYGTIPAKSAVSDLTGNPFHSVALLPDPCHVSGSECRSKTEISLYAANLCLMSSWDNIRNMDPV